MAEWISFFALFFLCAWGLIESSVYLLRDEITIARSPAVVRRSDCRFRSDSGVLVERIYHLINSWKF